MAQINKPTDYFNTILTAGGAQSITGVGFQPDLVWNKRRDDTSDHHLNDAVRGATKLLYPNQTLAEQTNANFISSFDSDGFTTGSGYWTGGASIVAWNWLASNTTASNTDGSITSTVSANTTSGFSIVSYTGTGANATVGHGLNSVPKIVIIKNRDRTSGWHVGGDAIGSVNQYLNLNDTNAIDSAGTGFQSFSSTTFGIGSDTDWNASGESIIAYCFSEKKGFSKFGSYTGNGSADGTFVYTGFKPAFVILKITNSTNNWHMYDNKRDTYNVADAVLYPNTSGAEGTDTTADFLSNGFKLRTSINFANGSGDSYIYMAFAENPFVTSGGIPTTAR